MSQRDPIITLCDYLNGVGYQIHPDEFRRYIHKGNVEEFRTEMHRQLDLALDHGVRMVEVLDNVDKKEISDSLDIRLRYGNKVVR